MNFRILFAVLIAFEGSWNVVQARTPADVITDFEPAFQEIHNKFEIYENFVRSESDPMFEDVTEIVVLENTNLNLTIVNTRQDIERTVWVILEDLGMTNHLDLIPHCITNLNQTENTLVATALGGQRICIQSVLDKVVSTSTYVKTLLTELHNEHTIVEATREECGKLIVPFDVQTCLINDLYLYYPSYFNDVHKEVENRVGNIEANLKNTVEDLEMCDGFLKEGIEWDRERILKEFIQCVYDARPF